MNNLKRLFFTVSILAIFNISVFAKSGFEFILNIPLQMGIGIMPKYLKDNAGANGEVSFDGGITAQFGYMTQMSSRFGISLLAEFGYSHDTIAASLNASSLNLGIEMYANRVAFSYSFDSLQIGLFPKFNIGNFAIGIGGGIKIPMKGKLTTKVINQEQSNELGRGDIANIISPAILGYVKTSLDYSIFFKDNFAFNIGLYLGYDIAKDKSLDINGKKIYYGILDIGVELGLKYGAKID